MDPHNYEADQLVIGTILFTIMLFLFPTLLAFHLLFLGVWCVVWCVGLGVFVFCFCITRFPLLRVGIVLWDSTFLPTSVFFVPFSSSSSSSSPPTSSPPPSSQRRRKGQLGVCQQQHLKMKSKGTTLATLLTGFIFELSTTAKKQFS
jgi:N-acetylglucosaminyl transferase component (Gpi1)